MKTVPGEAVLLVVCDVDGVLTDGVIGIDSSGEEFKHFSVLDGMGITLLRRAGIEVAFLSGRSSAVVEHRALGLGVRLYWSGIDDKRVHLEGIIARSGQPEGEMSDRSVGAHEICYIGDDVNDLGCLALVGFPVAVANARPEVKEKAAYVTKARGGEGALREVAELILRARGSWQSVLESYS